MKEDTTSILETSKTHSTIEHERAFTEAIAGQIASIAYRNMQLSDGRVKYRS
ncbi:MAG: hypothetical protein AAFP76_12150 [Bacteroidota bacterium]